MINVPGSGVGAGVVPARQAEAPIAIKVRAKIDCFTVPSEFGFLVYFVFRFRQMAYPAPPAAAVASMMKVPGSGVAGTEPPAHRVATPARRSTPAKIEFFTSPPRSSLGELYH
jgi:hypothetical protein